MVTTLRYSMKCSVVPSTTEELLERGFCAMPNMTQESGRVSRLIPCRQDDKPICAHIVSWEAGFGIGGL